MKTLLTSTLVLTAILFSAHPGRAQEITKSVDEFNRVVVSPRINLILEEGDREEVRLVYSGVSRDKINVQVRARKLEIFLDDSRITEKLRRTSYNGRQSVYADASVTAYVTYRQLRHIEIRGHQELTCKTPLGAEKFVLKAYGENEITLSSVKTNYLKMHLYGENQIKIKGGKAEYQKYKLYGENKIDTEDLKSYSTTATIFGESRIRLSSQDELRINSFGEADVAYNGTANLNKGLIIGRTRIRKID